MRKIIPLLLGSCLLAFSFSTWAVDSEAALKTFRSELDDIRAKLQSGKMSAIQAQILLSAIQVRQNNVLIAQNEELLKRLTHESK